MDISRLDLRPHKLFYHLDEVQKWRRGESFAPIFIEMSATDLCNQACWFCYTNYLKHKRLELGRDVLINTFKSMAEFGVKSVMIQGTGEPLLNKALPEGIVAGKASGLSIALCSNGVLLSGRRLEMILPAIEWTRISAVECNPQLYARSHGCPEAQWHSVIKNLKDAVALREREKLDVVLGVHFMLFDYNAVYVVETTKMMKALGIDYIMIKPGDQNQFNEDHKWDRDFHVRYRDLIEEAKTYEDSTFLVNYREDLFQKQEEVRGVQEICDPQRRGFEKCYGLEFEALVDADGGVYPCNLFWRNHDYCYGKLNEQSFEEIWRSKKRKRIVQKIFDSHDLSKCRFGCKQMHINKAQPFPH